MGKRKFSEAALAWLREYGGSIDSTALLMAFEAGERAAVQRAEAATDLLREAGAWGEAHPRTPGEWHDTVARWWGRVTDFLVAAPAAPPPKPQSEAARRWSQPTLVEWAEDALAVLRRRIINDTASAKERKLVERSGAAFAVPSADPLVERERAVVEKALEWEDAENQFAATDALAEAVAALRASRAPAEHPTARTTPEEALRLFLRGRRTDEEAAVACKRCGGETRDPDGGEWSICRRCKGSGFDPDASAEAVAVAKEIGEATRAAVRGHRSSRAEAPAGEEQEKG
jgi:hypothetical protein